MDEMEVLYRICNWIINYIINMDKILLVGESWISNASHFKGWDSFQSATYHVGADYLLNLLDYHYR